MEHSTIVKPSGPHIKITLRCDHDEHDGYCSEPEDMKTVTHEQVSYIPVDQAWTIPKMSWTVDGQEQGHCCCGAKTVWTILSIEMVFQ